MRLIIRQEKITHGQKRIRKKSSRCNLMSDYITAKGEELRISIMKHYYDQQLKPNTIDDIHRWWEVIDRTTDEPIQDWGI